MQLKGKAIGGPRAGVTLEADWRWDGIVHYRNGRGAPIRYNGRYTWNSDTHVWEWSTTNTAPGKAK